MGDEYMIQMCEVEKTLSFLRNILKHKKESHGNMLDLMRLSNNDEIYQKEVTGLRYEIDRIDGTIWLLENYNRYLKEKQKEIERELSPYRSAFKPINGFVDEITTEEIAINPYLQDAVRVYGEPMLSAEPVTAITSQSITEIINQGISRLEDS
jgi:hypothetical protein